MFTGIILAVVTAAGYVTRRLWPDAIVRAVVAALAVALISMAMKERADWAAPLGAIVLFGAGFAAGAIVRRARARPQ